MHRNQIQNPEGSYKLRPYQNRSQQQRQGFRFQVFRQMPSLVWCLMSSPKEQQRL
jgi:hypothetical protein